MTTLVKPFHSSLRRRRTCHIISMLNLAKYNGGADLQRERSGRVAECVVSDHNQILGRWYALYDG
eukprot:6176254-Pleurochrysis_carterae.AAC.1